MRTPPTAAEAVKLLKGTSLKWQAKFELAKKLLPSPEPAFPGKTAFLLEWTVGTMVRVGYGEAQRHASGSHGLDLPTPIAELDCWSFLLSVLQSIRSGTDPRALTGPLTVDLSKVPFVQLFQRAFGATPAQGSVEHACRVLAACCRCLRTVDLIWGPRAFDSVEQLGPMAAELLRRAGSLLVSIRVESAQESAADVEDVLLAITFLVRKLHRRINRESNSKKVYAWGTKHLFVPLLVLHSVIARTDALRLCVAPTVLALCSEEVMHILRHLLSLVEDIIGNLDGGHLTELQSNNGTSEGSTFRSNAAFELCCLLREAIVGSEGKDRPVDPGSSTISWSAPMLATASLPFLLQTIFRDRPSELMKAPERLLAMRMLVWMVHLALGSCPSSSSSDGTALRVAMDSVSELISYAGARRWHRAGESTQADLEQLMQQLLDAVDVQGDCTAPLVAISALLKVDFSIIDTVSARVRSLILSLPLGHAQGSQFLATLFWDYSSTDHFCGFLFGLFDALLSQPAEVIARGCLLADSTCRLEFSRSLENMSFLERSKLLQALGDLYFARMSEGSAQCSAKRLRRSLGGKILVDYLVRLLVDAEPIAVGPLHEQIVRRALDAVGASRGQNAASCLRLASAALQGIRVSGDAGLASGMLHWAGLDKPAESLGEAYYEMRCFRLLSVLRVHDRASHGGVPIPANTNAGKIERAVKSAAQAHATQFNCDELDATDETICLPFASETALWTDASASQLYDQLFRDELSFADAFNRQGYTLPVVPTAPWTSADLWERRELHRLLQEVSRRAPFSISILLQTPPPALSVPFMRSIISSIARQLQSSTSFRVCFGLGKLLLRLIRSSGQLEAEDWQIAFTACFSFAGGLSGFGLLSDAEQTDLIEMWTQLASWLARVALDSSGGTDELESPLFGALTSLADKPDDLLRSPVGTSALAAVCHIIATWIAKHSPEVLDLRALRDALQRLHRATLRKPEIIRDNYYAVIKLLWQLTLLDYSFAVMEPSKVLQCVRLTFGYLESCCQRQLGATTVINGVSAAKSIGEISLVLQQWLSHAGILGHNLSVEDTLDLMFNAELCCESDGESWSSRMVPALGALLDSYGMDRVFDGVVDILERRSTRPDGRAPALATLVGLFGLGSKSPAGRKSLRAYQRAARTLDIVQGIGVSSKTGPRTAPLLVSLLDCVVRARRARMRPAELASVLSIAEEVGARFHCSITSVVLSIASARRDGVLPILPLLAGILASACRQRYGTLEDQEGDDRPASPFMSLDDMVAVGRTLFERRTETRHRLRAVPLKVIAKYLLPVVAELCDLARTSARASADLQSAWKPFMRNVLRYSGSHDREFVFAGLQRDSRDMFSQLLEAS